MKLEFAAAASLVLASAGLAQVTQRVSVSTLGQPGNNWSVGGSISRDGRFVAFPSFASNLVPGDTNATEDMFVRDRRAGTTERVSIGAGGVEGNAQSGGGIISADGRYVCFSSYASNLVPWDTNGQLDAFLFDRLSQAIERVSVGSAGQQGNNFSAHGPISADGRYVLFYSIANNLIPNVPSSQLYVRDRQSQTTDLVAWGMGGAIPNNESWGGSMSNDGRFIAFVSLASNLVPGDTNYDYDVFVRDFQNGTTERVNVSSSGGQAGYNPDDSAAWISGDGRYVAFMTGAANLVPGDTNGHTDIFVHDRRNGTTERVNVGPGGQQANGDSGYPWISEDGRYVAFVSGATNLGPVTPSGWWNVFVHDRQTGANELASVSSSGEPANGPLGIASVFCSADGRFVVFNSSATNLVPGGAYGTHVYVHDRSAGPSMTNLCEPGTGVVVACPCSNPPGGAARGCDNSVGTGGATLSALGGTYLSSDSLEFMTRGELPTSLSILTQWTGVNATGAIFGQGVRCTSGSFKRLYTKAAVNGSITAPYFAANDAQVSVRSAALGDTILTGQSRWYLVVYRDPIVLGGCPASSTFNATQTGQVTWWP